MNCHFKQMYLSSERCLIIELFQRSVQLRIHCTNKQTSYKNRFKTQPTGNKNILMTVVPIGIAKVTLQKTLLILKMNFNMKLTRSKAISYKINSKCKYICHVCCRQSDSLKRINDEFPTSQKAIDKEKNIFESKMVNGYFADFYDNQINASTRTFTINKLRHFSIYSISVQACRDFHDPSFDAKTFCSNAVMLNRRTAKIGSL